MARFADLPHAILRRIAVKLISNRLPECPDRLGLLPLRLVHPNFKIPVNYCIFRTSKVKADVSIIFPWLERSEWSSAGLFLESITENRSMSAYVNDLTFTLNGPEGAFIATRFDKMHQCVQILSLVGPYLRSLRLQGDTTGEGPFEWRTGVSWIRFSRLQRFEMSSYYLPLLGPILGHSPHLKKLCIGDDPRWAYKNHRSTRTYASPCQNIPLPKLELLSVNHASDFGMLLFLAEAPLRASRVELTVSVWEPSGLFSLAEGIRTWPVFQEVEHITFVCEEPLHRRLAVFIDPLRERKLAFSFVRETLNIPLLEET